MGIEIAISVAREETRVAVLDGGVVTDLFGDRAKHKDFVGNVYKGKVAKVLPGMEAAFVDIGLEKAAFMHVSDPSEDAEPGDTLVDADDDDDKDADMLGVGMVVITEELLRSSAPSAEMLVRDDLVKTIAEFLDVQFIAPDYAASANVSPASITNGVVPTAATGTALANLRTDVQTLLNAFITNQIPLSGLVWIMHPSTALAISNMQNSLGQNEFANMGITGGTFFGLPAVASESALQVGSPVTGEGKLLVLASANDILLADDGQVDVEASREASIQMLDNPTNDTTTPTATTLVSMWQTNSVALRAVRFINWGKAGPTSCST